MSNKHVDQESSTEDKMAVTTRGKLRKYLISNEIPVTDITPISGGSSNFVWRITNPSGQSSIIKLAEPFLVGNSAIPFPLDRQDFEARALTKIPKLISNDETIRIPALLHFDTENHILRLEDVGSKTLKDRYEDPKLDIQKIGESIGRWLARLHTSTTSEEVKRPFDHSVAKSMYRWNYNNLSSVLGKYGFDPTLGERINAKYGALLQTDDVCICHGDMWPGNVLFPESDAEEENLKFAIIDWEVARLGNGVTDLGHFAGEAWFLDRLRGGRGFLGAFFGGLCRGEKFRDGGKGEGCCTVWDACYILADDLCECLQG
jgi:5-methylthioribose kinase